MDSMVMLTLMKKHTKIYENYMRLKLLKALEYTSGFAIIPKSVLFTSMNAFKALYLILYYCCANGDNLLAVYAFLLLGENSDAHSAELVLWLNQSFLFDHNRLKFVICKLKEINSNYFKLPGHIVGVFKCHAGYCGIETYDLSHEMVILDDHSPLKEESVEMIQSNTFFPALLDTFVTTFETKLQKMFEHITIPNGFIMSDSTLYILALFYGLLTHDEVGCFSVISLFLNTEYGRYEDILTQSENIIMWLMSSLNLEKNIFDGPMECFDQLLRIQRTPALQENMPLKKLILNLNKKKPVLITILPRIRLESFDLNNRADMKLLKSSFMQPHLSIRNLKVETHVVGDELLAGECIIESNPYIPVCSDSCKISFQICQETFWIPRETSQEIIGIINRIYDAVPSRDDTLYTNLQKIIKILWLSKGYQLPVSSNNLCHRCFVRLFEINIPRDRTLESLLPSRSPEDFLGFPLVVPQWKRKPKNQPP